MAGEKANSTFGIFHIFLDHPSKKVIVVLKINETPFFRLGDLCAYESSLDELAVNDPDFRARRARRSSRSNERFPPVVIVRSWGNWGGGHGDPAVGNPSFACQSSLEV